MADLSSFSAALKTQFIGPIRDNIYKKKVLLYGMRTRDGKDTTPVNGTDRSFNGISSSAEGIDYVGNTFRIPIHSAPNQGVGFRAEGGKLPAAGNQGYKYITDNLKYVYGRFSLTGPLMKASESDKGAFQKALTEEMNRLSDDVKQRLNAAAFGSGNGVVATVSSGANSATQTLDTTIYLDGQNEYVDIYSSDLNTYRGSTSVSITSVDRSAKQVVLSSSVNTTTNDVLIFASSDSTSSAPNNDKSAVINGLQNIVASSGALHNLNPASAGEGFWKSYVHAAGGDVIGENILRTVKDEIGFASGSDDDLLMVTTRGIVKRYASSLTAMKRFNDAQSVNLHGGFKAVLFDETPMVADDHCPVGNLFALNTQALLWMKGSDFEWMEQDGSILKWNSGYDSYTAILFNYMNLGTTARNRHARVSGAADDSR